MYVPVGMLHAAKIGISSIICDCFYQKNEKNGCLSCELYRLKSCYE